MSTLSTLQLPQEHGSWGMFLIPLVLGFMAGGRLTSECGLVAVAATAAFLAREPLMTWWRAWRRGSKSGHIGWVYAAIAATAGLVLLPNYPWLVVPGILGGLVFALQAELSMRGWGRTAAVELIAIAVSMLLAPAAWYVSSGQLGVMALLLWSLCFGYFASSVFYVKMRVAAARPTRPADPERTRRDCLAYHSALVVYLLIVATGTSALLPLGFAPVLARAFWFAFRPTPVLNLKQVGWTEVAYSVWFLGVTGVTVSGRVS